MVGDDCVQGVQDRNCFHRLPPVRALEEPEIQEGGVDQILLAGPPSLLRWNSLPERLLWRPLVVAAGCWDRLPAEGSSCWPWEWGSEAWVLQSGEGQLRVCLRVATTQPSQPSWCAGGWPRRPLHDSSGVVGEAPGWPAVLPLCAGRSPALRSGPSQECAGPVLTPVGPRKQPPG